MDVTIKPTTEMVANSPVEVTDASGRRITLRKPPFTAQFKLIKALGAGAANSTYSAMVAPVLYVGAIDGAPVPIPTTEDEMMALLARLDEGGYKAVTDGIIANFAAAEVDEATVKN